MSTGMWQGVFVEPHPEQFRRLCGTYQGLRGVTCLNAAVMPESGEREMFFVRDPGNQLPDWGGGLSSFSRATILKHESEISGLSNLVYSAPVRCVDWAVALESLGTTQLDLLQIDVEGLDYELLRHFPFERIRPGVVRYEHKHLSGPDRDASMDMLVGRGYALIVEGQDTIAFGRTWKLPVGSEPPEVEWKREL